jgi:hypothetical protein
MTELVGLIAIAVVAWFAAGTIWNVHLGREVLRWMQGGLPILGQRTTVRWLGSTAVEMVIHDGKPPFSAATVVIFLEARDLPWMWALGRSGGRRDTLIIRGALRRSPAFEVEALDPMSWSGRDARSRVPAEWQVRQAEGFGVSVHHPDAAALARADKMLALAQRTRLTISRLSVRRSEPNFQIHVARPDRSQPARELFEMVHALAELALD